MIIKEGLWLAATKTLHFEALRLWPGEAVATSPYLFNSTFLGSRGQAITGSVRFSLWFFSCMSHYLFFPVPSLRLIFQAAAEGCQENVCLHVPGPCSLRGKHSPRC